jgi:regulator of protease activity HflC (stomatin/prohibitin superfamily)
MVWFVFAIILAISGVIALFVRKSFNEAALRAGDRRYSSYETNPATVASGAGWTAAVCFVLAVLFLLFSCLTKVGTKEEGVVTSFGQPKGTLDNGLHFKAPWEKVTEFDAAIQTDSHTGGQNGGDGWSGDCNPVRIGNGTTACVDNTIRWRIVPDSADDLYRDYREFESVRESLVTRQLNAAIQKVYADYDPLANLDSTGQTSGPSLTELGDQVEAELQDKIDSQIEVLSVLTPLIRFDDATEAKIGQLQQEITNTRIAHQQEQTARANANANHILADSVSDNPNVLVSRCFDALTSMIKASQPVPPGFSCWPGSNSALVVPSATTK